MLSIENRTSQPFRGFLSATVANAPAEATHGWAGGFPIVLGPSIGLRGRQAHVLAELDGGEVVLAEPTWGGPPPPPLGPMPGNNPAEWIAALGIPTINRVPLIYGGITPSNGGPLIVHLYARFTRMLVAHLSIYFTPDQDFAEFDLTITASNPAVPEVSEILGDDIVLTCGRALVQFTSGAAFNKAMSMGDSFGDSQMRCFFGAIMWPHLANPMELVSGAGFVTGGIGFVDLDWFERIGPLGTAPAPTAWNPSLYVHANYNGAMHHVRDWLPNWPLGIAAASGDSGEQEDQGFGGKGTAIVGGGFGAAQLLRLVAMGWGKRPCNYLEANGVYLRLDRDLAIWSGRPIFWSPDQLGKPRQPSEAECHGWSGPDNQHCFMNEVCAAWQLTGRPSLQRIIHHQGILFLYSQTLRADWATSMVDASRAWGWMALMAVQLYTCLEDRDLAERIRERFMARLQLYIQATGGSSIWDVHPNDHDGQGNIIGVAREIWANTSTPTPFPSFWFTYQQGQAAGLLQIAGEVFDLPAARQLALLGAQGVLEHAYDQDGTEWESLGILPSGQTVAQRVEGEGAHRTGNFATAWLPLAPWTVLRHEPNNERARFLYERARAGALATTKNIPADWIAPL